MEIKLHANATTTPRIRRYIQQSVLSDRALAQELGISVTTVRRWRQRQSVADKQTTPNKIRRVLSEEQSTLINWLRQRLQLPLDELLMLVNQGMGLPVSRAALDRYLKPPRKSSSPTGPRGKQALRTGIYPQRLSLHYQRINLLPEDGGEWHVLWAKEPVSGWLSAKTYAGVSPALVVHWLSTVLSHCPDDIQSIETENKHLFVSRQYAVQPLQQWAADHGVIIITDNKPMADIALRVNMPLTQLFPVAQQKNLDELITHLCHYYNNYCPQKKLNGLAPSAFWRQCLQQGLQQETSG